MKKIPFILAILLLLSGCGNETADKVETEAEVEIETEIETEAPETGEIDAEITEPSVDQTKYAADGGEGLVSDGYVLELADPFYGTVCRMRLPQFNIDTPMTQELNYMIADQYFQKYAYCIADLENGESPYRVFNVTYEWADCGDVIAVVITDSAFVNGSDAGGTGYETLYYNKESDDLMDMDAFLEWYTDGGYNLETLASTVNERGLMHDIEGNLFTLTADEIQAILPHPGTGLFSVYSYLAVPGMQDNFVMLDYEVYETDAGTYSWLLVPAGGGVYMPVIVTPGWHEVYCWDIDILIDSSLPSVRFEEAENGEVYLYLTAETTEGAVNDLKISCANGTADNTAG